MVPKVASTSHTARASVIAGLLALGFPLLVSAQSFVPARLIHLPSEHLACPISERASPVIICQAVITKRGLVFDTHCFGDVEEDRDRADLVRGRVMLALFEPATVEGRRTKVYASFRLWFHEENGVCNITYLPNLGAQQDEFGLEYFDPQEILTHGSWMARARPTWRRDRGAGIAFSMSVAVDELGNATDGRVESNNFAPKETVAAAVQALEESRFIPAFVDGVPRRARYVEILYVRPGCRSGLPAMARRDRC